MLKKNLSLWGPVVLWALIIFLFSSQPTIKASEVYLWDFILKKNAHLFEFFILYIFIFRAINKQKKIKKIDFFCPLFLIVIYAISDEFHQSFVPGREARTKDAIIDSFGGVIAIWFLKKFLPKMPKKLSSWVISVERD